jgi:hypothetical protein
MALAAKKRSCGRMGKSGQVSAGSFCHDECVCLILLGMLRHRDQMMFPPAVASLSAACCSSGTA